MPSSTPGPRGLLALSPLLALALAAAGCDDYRFEAGDDDRRRCKSNAECDTEAGYACVSTGVCQKVQRLDGTAACPGEPPLSTTALGVCQGVARQICLSDGTYAEPHDRLHFIAQAIPGYAPEDTGLDCLDNDCNGLVDDGVLAPLAVNVPPIAVGHARQVCDGRGQYVDPGLDDLREQGRRGLIPDFEEPETRFDCLDNDLDGRIDEGLTAPLAFPDRQLGVLAGVRMQCVDGRLQAPEPASVPGFEVCETTFDCLDNDGDGRVDQQRDDPSCASTPRPVPPRCTVGNPQSTAPRSRCQAGLYICRDGQPVCVEAPDYTCEANEPPSPIVDVVGPIAEVCANLIDDDCDGKVDEQCLGGPCTVRDDCPGDVTLADGRVLEVTCDDRFPSPDPTIGGGLCAIDCACGACYRCRRDADDPAAECVGVCGQCDEVNAVCATMGATCVPLLPPGRPFQEGISACSLGCDSEDPESTPCRPDSVCERGIGGVFEGCVWPSAP